MFHIYPAPELSEHIFLSQNHLKQTAKLICEVLEDSPELHPRVPPNSANLEYTQ